ncbi:patatin-like phospholipase family protein [Shewanella sp. Isolate7]|uniref:patatin-like phospholipase family protein n=1 Tax=Shewanella sp. Isolate7 TaxID=2908528 RepID=UPI001EFED68B|nr:patatin-like phospholipase family protein [Shewanella sp. Isolate7]MCG9721997.1 patatin-like phospholipase family protein [Shewanella sp. Isolate7]
MRRLPITVFLTLFLAACSSTHTLETRVTKENYRTVTLAAETQHQADEPYRVWGDDASDFLFNAQDGSTPLKVQGDRLNILALSGGGANGAFGAGIINGLYDSQQLQDYTVITGISAGSLIAPFVFVGGDEIPRLKEVMLGINDKMILGKRNLLNTLIKDAFTNGEQMFEFIEQVYTPEMIEQIALQHQAGRRLFIGTTHFDSEELVVWNLGRIAESDLPNKVTLIHQILAASSSIPGVFPPQFIEVNQGDKTLEELHVDGGLTVQMFFEVVNVDYGKINEALGLTTTPQVHIIRNGMLKVPYQATEDKGVELLSRSLGSMTIQQAKGDLYRMLYFSKNSGLELSFTYMDDEFNAPKATKDMFDLQYMKALYQHGYSKAKSTELWSTEVP